MKVIPWWSMQDRCITDMLLNNRTAIFSVFCFTLLCLGITRYYRKNIFFLFRKHQPGISSFLLKWWSRGESRQIFTGSSPVERRFWFRLWIRCYKLYAGTMELSYPHWSAVSCKNKSESEQELNIQKDMVSFIYQHYPEKISLTDIAAAGHVGRSKCCQIFKHYMQQSPVDFLNTYRLKISCRLLCTTQKSITEIAILCGFNHLSYFSKYFMECYGCTPREYRTLHEHETLLTWLLSVRYYSPISLCSSTPNNCLAVYKKRLALFPV